jgi:hypothetical protein
MASRPQVATVTHLTKPAVLGADLLPLGDDEQPIREVGIQRTSELEPVALNERIRLRAWEIYLARDGQNGSETEDWLQAEQEISSLGSVSGN